MSANNLILTGGAGGLVGYAIGYAAKKILRIGLILFGLLAGAELVLLKYLENQGILTVTVNQPRLTLLSQSILLWASGQASMLAGVMTQDTVLLGSGAAGFALGFKKG